MCGFSEDLRQALDFKPMDIFDVTFAGLRICIGGVFVDDSIDAPSHKLANNSDHAARTML
jgi:hypothetical protein